jgi:hypothetical protein
MSRKHKIQLGMGILPKDPSEQAKKGLYHRNQGLFRKTLLEI